MMKFGEETRLRRNQYHVMVTLRGRFMGDMGGGGGWNILPLVDVSGLVIQMRKLVGR